MFVGVALIKLFNLFHFTDNRALILQDVPRKLVIYMTSVHVSPQFQISLRCKISLSSVGRKRLTFTNWAHWNEKWWSSLNCILPLFRSVCHIILSFPVRFISHSSMLEILHRTDMRKKRKEKRWEATIAYVSFWLLLLVPLKNR